MSIGVWTPSVAEPLNSAQLLILVQKLPKAPLDHLDGLNVDDFQAYRSWMKAEASLWEAAEDLEAETKHQLIRFFTLAERDWVGWDAGKTSPVIPLVAGLKRMDQFDPEFRRWIKSNTDNRYLPNGAVL